MRFTKANPALYQLDEKPEGFEWINGMEWEKNLLIFLTQDEEERRYTACRMQLLECRVR